MQDMTSTRSDGREGELIWLKSKWSRLQFELHAGDAIVATLHWVRGTRAVGRWAEAEYYFIRRGWLRPRILVSKAPAEAAELPLGTMNYRSGSLLLTDGRTLTWKKPKRLTRERVWVDSAGIELVRFRPAKHSAMEVITQQDAARQLELPLMILLGQYLMVLAGLDAEAASTAAVAAVVASS